jgi:hypothetical protein
MTADARVGVEGTGEGATGADAEPSTSRTPGEHLKKAGPEARGDPATPVKDEEVNSIRPARIRRRPVRPPVAGDAGRRPPRATSEFPEKAEREMSSPPRPPTSAGKAESDPWTVPEQVRDRFLQDGNRFYFEDGTLAFRDQGRKLSTPSENTEVIASLIEIARVRGWQEITLEGTERFRGEAWRQGRIAGLAVRGYKPSAEEHVALMRALSDRESSPDTAGASAGAPPPPEAQAAVRGVTNPLASEPRKRADELIVGTLAEHGREAYRFDPHAEISYFVRIQTPHGPRTIWGKDLERALGESLTHPKIGDEIGMRRVGSEPVTVKRRERNAGGEVLKEEEVPTHRHRWVLEKREFFDSRAKAAETFRNSAIEPRDGARKHPELVHAYLYLHAAELAVHKKPDPEERRKFVEAVRGLLADSIARGERLKPVRLRDHSAPPPELARAEAPARA